MYPRLYGEAHGSDSGSDNSAGENGEDDDDNDDDDDDEENAHRLRSALMQGGRASLWRLVPPTDMKAEEVDEATPKNADPDQRVAKRMELSTPY